MRIKILVLSLILSIFSVGANAGKCSVQDGVKGIWKGSAEFAPNFVADCVYNLAMTGALKSSGSICNFTWPAAYQPPGGGAVKLVPVRTTQYADACVLHIEYKLKGFDDYLLDMVLVMDKRDTVLTGSHQVSHVNGFMSNIFLVRTSNAD